MTDPRRPDDELVSAVLDGEATTAERARVAADPALAARLAEFETVRRAVAGPVQPVDDATRDRTLARALAAAGPGAAETGADVVGLDRARDRHRAPTSRRVLMVAAAVFAVVALGGGLLTLGDGDGDQDRAAETAEEDAGSATGGLAVPDLDLGTVDDPETLRDRINETTGLTGQPGPDTEAFATDPPADDTGDSDSSTEEDQADAPAERASPTLEDCAIQLIETRPQLIGQLAQGTVTYQGTAAFVIAYNDAATGAAVAIVAAVDDCTVLVEVPL